MEEITVKAYGKLNLCLDVTGKREDGYHLVKMIMQTVDIYDTVTIRPAASGEITLHTNSGDIPAGPSCFPGGRSDAQGISSAGRI